MAPIRTYRRAACTLFTPHGRTVLSCWRTRLKSILLRLGLRAQLAGVQYILDTVVAALAANPDRTFVYAEMARAPFQSCITD